jgi:hypothetical protein
MGKNNKKYTYEEVKQYVENLGYLLISKEYINNKTNLIIQDSYGYLYSITLSDLKCYKYFWFVKKSNPFSIQNIRLWCRLNNKPFELLSDTYENNSTVLKWKCLNEKCDQEFQKDWGHIFRGQGCHYCTKFNTKVSINNCLATKNPELAKEWHPTKNSDLTPFDVTANSGIVIWWKCSKNEKHEWTSVIANRNKGRMCPYCEGKLPSEDYNLLVCNPILCEEWDYNKNNKKPEEYCPNSNKYAWWKCKECGNEWSTPIQRRNSGQKSGCPECNKSKGENQTKIILNNNNIYNIPQHTFPDCKYINVLEFDFYLPDFTTCIEFQGQQHYFPVDFAGRGKKWADEEFRKNQIRDQIKRNYCKENNIKLIEVPYYDFDNIEEILNKELNLNNYNNIT